MLKRKKGGTVQVRNVTARWIDHLAGYIIFLAEKQTLEIRLILRVVSEQQNLTML